MAQRWHNNSTARVTLVLLGLAALVSGWAVGAHLRTDRPSSDPLAIELGKPDPQVSSLEGHMAWALRVLGGELPSETAINERFSPAFVEAISPAQFVSVTSELLAQGPWRFHGFDKDDDVGFSTAMITDGNGEVHALSVTADPFDPERLSGLLVAPVGDEAVSMGPFTGVQISVHVGAVVALAVVAVVAMRFRRRDLGLLLGISALLFAAHLLEVSDRPSLFTVSLLAGPLALGVVGAATVCCAGLDREALARRKWLRAVPTALIGAVVLAWLPVTAIDTAALSLPENLLSRGHDRTLLATLNMLSASGLLIAVVVVIFGVVGAQVDHHTVDMGRTAAVLGAILAAMLVAIPAAAMLDSQRSFDLSQTPVASVAAIVAAAGIAASVSVRQPADLGAMMSILSGGSTARQLTSDPLEPLLRQALADPDAQLLRWSADEQTYVSASGSNVTTPLPSEHVTMLASGDHPLGAVLHSRTVPDLEPAQSQAVIAALRVVLENEQLHAKLRTQLGEVQLSRARILEAGESARRRIERDLHDGAQQRLLGVLLHVQSGRHEFQESGEFDQFLASVATDLSGAITDLRELARGVHPAILDQGLDVALESLAETSVIATRVDTRGLQRCGQPVEHAAYFVIGEALANAARHSQATVIDINATRQGDQLMLTVSDDGVGGAKIANGAGLQNIDDRVHALGGTWSLQSSPQSGTTIRAVLPCE